MTVRVRVRDFQSLRDASLDIQGFTVVTGPNNSGKTAFIRAIRGAFQNTKGSSFVRRGCAKTTVEITFDDDQSLVWEKGAKIKPSYSINGGPPIHPGQGVPDEVKALGIRGIKAGGEEVWPQIAPQFHQVFLIDQPGSVLAEAVADVDRVGHLNEALKAAKSDQTRANSTLQVRLSDIAALTEELAQFEGLEQSVEELKALEADLQKAQKIQRAHEGVMALSLRYDLVNLLLAKLAPVEVITLPPESESEALTTLLVQRDALAVLGTRLDVARSAEARWAPLEGVAVPPAQEVEDLRVLHGDLIDAARWSSRLEAARLQVAKWLPVEGVSLDVDETPVVKVSTALSVLQEFQRRLDTARDLCGSLEQKVLEAERDAAETQKAFSDYLDEIGECPVCGQGTSHERGHE
jgi:exonuclease SbcC